MFHPRSVPASTSGDSNHLPAGTAHLAAVSALEHAALARDRGAVIGGDIEWHLEEDVVLIGAALAIGTTACTADLPDPPFIPPPETAFLDFEDHGPRNVLMLSIDTLRRDHISRYGDHDLTPFLAEKLQEGVALDDARSCSNWTMPSALCAWGGRTGTDMDFIPPLPKSRRVPVPDGHQHLPTWLRDAGYQTGLVSANSYLSDDWNTAQGFDEVHFPGFQTAEKLNVDGLKMLEEFDQDPRPWFVHLHYRDCHVPYDPPSEYLAGLEDLEPVDVDFTQKDETYGVAKKWPDMTEEEQALLEAHFAIRYEGTITYTDDAIRTLWEGLEEHGTLDDTLVVVWSDHGEQFWEHGNHSHAHTMNYGENDALAFFWSPNLTAAPWTGVTSHIDLAPTILEALGLPIPEEVTGLPVGLGTPDRPLHTVSDARQGILQSLSVGTTKLQYHWSGEKALYHRDVDREETNNVYDSADPEVEALWEILAPELDRVARLVPESKVAVEPGP